MIATAGQIHAATVQRRHATGMGAVLLAHLNSKLPAAPVCCTSHPRDNAHGDESQQQAGQDVGEVVPPAGLAWATQAALAAGPCTDGRAQQSWRSPQQPCPANAEALTPLLRG